MPEIHIVGAGMAGLAAAVDLVRMGHQVTLHEASGQAGGRCRSYVDARLGCLIDNGNHLLLSGNRDTMGFLEAIGAPDALTGPAVACFPFLDLRTGQAWSVRPNPGRLPWWVFARNRRVPGTTPWAYLSAFRFALAGPDRTVTDCVAPGGALFGRFWEPLAVAVLNAPPETAAAHLLWPVFRETFARGEAACRPRVAADGLSRAFVDPALAFLRRNGAEIRLNHRLTGVAFSAGRAVCLNFGDGPVALGDGDAVVLALPPAPAGRMVPSLVTPRHSHAIVNGHFRLSEPVALPGGAPFLGLIGGVAQWLFVRGDVASVTISAADALIDAPAEVIARKTWRDVAVAIGAGPEALPAYRIIKEKRATFAQTPGDVRRRPPTRSGFSNLFLAGDWVDTGLPATIEGAVRSGRMAARAVTGG